MQPLQAPFDIGVTRRNTQSLRVELDGILRLLHALHYTALEIKRFIVVFNANNCIAVSQSLFRLFQLDVATSRLQVAVENEAVQFGVRKSKHLGQGFLVDLLHRLFNFEEAV